MLVIGIDCATKATNTGMVLASRSNEALRLESATVGSEKEPCLDVLSKWISRDPNVLLALDAPLGWPRPWGPTLAEHSAGEVVREAPDKLFSRMTDRRITERLDKRPLEVGANLIARTAHAALRLLDSLRRETGHSIPLVWEAKDFEEIGAIEVYPAATRIALKAPKDPATFDGLADWMEGDLSNLGANPHVLDAAWCAAAGADFLAGRAQAPTPSELDAAKGEGWIWVRGRE